MNSSKNPPSPAATATSSCVPGTTRSSRPGVIRITATTVAAALVAAACGNGPPPAPVPTVPPPPPVEERPLWDIEGTVYAGCRAFGSEDPSTLLEVRDAGRGTCWVLAEESGWDNAFWFDASYRDGSDVLVCVLPDVGDATAAREYAERYAWMVGQLPLAVRTSSREDRDLVLGLWLGYPGARATAWDGGFEISLDSVAGHGNCLQELLLHEAVHASLDYDHADSPGWRAAQEADGDFISDYARSDPDNEDLAETFPMWLALRYREDRIAEGLARTIRERIPNRLAYLDSLDLDVSPVR